MGLRKGFPSAFEVVMKERFFVKLLPASICLAACLSLPSYATSAVKVETQDSLTLTLVNASNQTIYFSNNMSTHNSNSYDFNLNKLILKPGQTALFHAKAAVYPGDLEGLGGTLFLHTKSNPSNVDFVIGDSPIGETLTPVIGLAKQDKANLSSNLTDVKNKNDPRAYDISIKTATVTITPETIYPPS